MIPVTARLCILNLVGTAALAAAWVSGQLDLVVGGDTTRISWIMLALLAAGIAAAFLGKWGTVKWVAEKLPALGLMATVVGIIVIARQAGAQTDVDAIRNATVRGVGLALGPNAVGIAGYIWLSTLSFLCNRGEDY